MNKKSIKSDLARIDRMREADIDYSDIPPLDKTFLKKADRKSTRLNSSH